MGISEQLSLETLFADVQRMDKRQVIHMQTIYLICMLSTTAPDGVITPFAKRLAEIKLYS